jgi:HEAT repeat protein
MNIENIKGMFPDGYQDLNPLQHNKKKLSNMDDELINKYIRELDDGDQEVWINAIRKLGETGDELCLKELRQRLKYLSQEHLALIIAVGKLKKDLGIK